MSPDMIVPSGVVGTLLIALYYIGKLILDAVRERREHRRDTRQVTTGTVTDATTANAALVQTLDALTKENERLTKRVKHLENERAEQDKKIADLEARTNEIAYELASLKGHR